MSVVKGLKNINALLDKPKYENDGPKVKWLKLADGQSVKIRKCLEELISMSPQQFQVKVDAQRIQNNDLPIQIGSAEKIRRDTGWDPQITLQQSLLDLLNDWRRRVLADME